MCGRFTLHTRLLEIEGAFEVDEVDEGLQDSYGPSYNIVPSQEVAVVTAEGGVRSLHRARWGITPGWDESKLLFNARAEGVAEKATFKKAFKTGRCVIVADGFYEWKRGGKVKAPYYFRLASEDVFGFAGILTRGRESNKSVRKECAIITTAANSLVGQVHNRMPVILRPEAIAPWLAQGSGRDGLLGLLSPLDPALMRGYEVGAAVNSAAHDTPENIVPVGGQG